MKTAAKDLSRSWMAWSTPDLVMARLLDCGMKRNEREESSSRRVETERLVRRDQSPPRRNQRGREVRAAVRRRFSLTGRLVGRGGNPRGGRVTVLTGAGVELTEGWKSLITRLLSF